MLKGSGKKAVPSDCAYRSGEGAKTAECLVKNGGERRSKKRFTAPSDDNYRGNSETSFAGGPLSAIASSMFPRNVITKLRQLEEAEGQPDYRFDEFGFKVEVEDGPEQSSNKNLIPFVEDPQHRLKWIAYLEFTHNKVVEELSWDKIDTTLLKSEKLQGMIRSGIPHSLRAAVWLRIAGATQKRKEASFTYSDALKLSNNDKLATGKQIEKDLLRTLPNNICFMNVKSPGIPRLRRVLRAVAYLYPEIGYCQGMGVIVCVLLLFMQEEEAFWMISCLIENLLPGNYYSRSLMGLQADQLLLKSFIGHFLPTLDEHFKKHDIELSLISINWFLTLFSSVFHIKVLLRFWDMLFYEGNSTLFHVAIAMLKIREADLCQCTNSGQLFNKLSELPTLIDDANQLLDLAVQISSSFPDEMITGQRKKQLAFLLAEQGVLVNPDNASGSGDLPKSRINRRKLKRSQSFVAHIFGSDGASARRQNVLDPDDVRFKNVRQTEILVDLKDAIIQVCNHFLAVNPDAYNKNNLQPDYTLESHARDHQNFVSVHKNRQKRARALLDFERRDDDELGFHRNDIISVICEKDEHCWIGELNGLRGWFPAKFVELLDERSKSYSAVGDDAVTSVVTDLVRGTLCPALKAVFDFGIKKTQLLGMSHPWAFIEEVAKKEVQKDFESVYSRLVLCKTFRLDEDGKVLTPEELLYKAVQQVNVSHDAIHAQLDVKFRSLICLGLNEQLLHLWFELLCTSEDVVKRWYQRWSYIRSPGWIQVKCDLRLLAQFPFQLAIDWELPVRQEPLNKPLKEGVRDMLVKHHLFSWDL